MRTSRRSFLKTGTISLLSVGAPAVLAKTAAGRPLGGVESRAGLASGDLNFTKRMFMPLVNTSFRVHTGSATVKIRLAKVTDLKTVSNSPARIAGRESFSLLFVDSRKTSGLTQDTYVVEHEALGRFSLFLVPIGQPETGHYEAIIIRL